MSPLPTPYHGAIKLLIIEDEAKTAGYLTRGLGEEGYRVDHATNGVDGLHLALTGDYDAIVLDIMLPGMDGLQVLQALRAQRELDHEHFAALQVRIRAALGSLVDAASTAGYVRSDVDVADLLRAVGGVCMATDDGWLDRTRRMVALLLDGLKYGAPNPR